MNEAERIESARRFLEAKIETEFSYPFQVTYEDGYFMFTLKNGRTECCAKLKQTQELIERLSEGSTEERQKELDRLYEVLKAAVRAQETAVFSKDSEFEKVKDRLILRPLNYFFFRDSIGDVPHIRIGDIALVLYAVMSHVGADYFTAKMHREQIAHWGIPEDEVLQTALVNTSFLYPPRLYSVEDMLAWDGKRRTDGRFMADGEAGKVRRGMRGYILTNTLEINGAVAIFYPGVARRIAEIADGDFYIAFTSIHEAQIHSAGMIPADVVERSLRETNRHCNPEEEVLTDQVYCYRAEKGSFGVIRDGEFLEVKRDE